MYKRQGEAGLLNALYDVGITMNDVNPDYVVVGEAVSYTHLVWETDLEILKITSR